MWLAGLLSLATACQQKSTPVRAVIETNMGNLEVELYDSTPRHRDNFAKLAEKGFYDSLLFHRVIEGFMIQGGDPDSRNAPPGQVLGRGGPGYEIDAEIGAPHYRGVLAAASKPNPEQRSSGSQFYIVQGQSVDQALLDAVEQQKGITYTEEQREVYQILGGVPQLDFDYTVFGELTDGFDVLDRIATVPTDASNRPEEDVIIQTIKIK